MNRRTFRLAVFTLAYTTVLAFVAWFGYQSHAKLRSVALMSDAANKFLASLAPEQKAKAALNFDDANRIDWTYVPRERKGLPLKEMNEVQRKLAHEFLKTGLSAYGYGKATTIMSLEPVLFELEGAQRRFPRDPELYFFSLYGTPGAKDRWGWRVEGHHISLNFTIVKGELLANAPLGFGANPAEVRAGPRKGLRALANEEDKGRELIQALDEQQRASALFDAKAPNDILTLGTPKADPLNPPGIPYGQLNAQQKEKLMKLLDEYLARMPEDLAKQRRDNLQKAGLATLHFAWAGGINKNDAHYYRVQSKTFLIEYDDSQNNANHIHTVWRDFDGDFGRDWLREHYQSAPHNTTQVNSAGEEKAVENGKSAVVRPQITYQEKAEYTKQARDNKVEGVVVLQVIFRADGSISNVEVLQGLPDGLAEKALEAVKKVRFKPATKAGVPIHVRGKIEYVFSLK